MKEKEEFMLTTYDNPFNPFDDFEVWWKTDLRLGHNCCGILASNAATSEVYSDEMNEQIIEEAVNDIIRRSPTIYKKVYRSDFLQMA